MKVGAYYRKNEDRIGLEKNIQMDIKTIKFWSRNPDSNRGLTPYHGVTLPTELLRLRFLVFPAIDILKKWKKQGCYHWCFCPRKNFLPAGKFAAQISVDNKPKSYKIRVL